MIRLGSLAGYPFEGPRVLGGWTPPATAAVFAILYRADPDAKPYDFAVLDVDHADDLREAGLPFGHPRAKCWERRAGNKWNLHICTYEVPGGLPSHREQIVREADRRLPTRLRARPVRPEMGKTNGSAATGLPPQARSPPLAAPAAQHRLHSRRGGARLCDVATSRIAGAENRAAAAAGAPVRANYSGW